ncbi:MAG: GNAT family N-acetyltransferase [Devosia sp.]|jgi:ribosomal protein S18 acetylase RimI-like enzyme
MSTLRPAKSEDLSAVAALIEAAYRHYVPILGRRPRPMDDDLQARLGNGELFVIEEDGTLLAVLTMMVQPAAVHIFNFAVHPDAQGRGLLRQMLDFAEAAARREDKSKLTLYTNAAMTRNRAIYAHLGFTETGEHDSPGGYRIVFMERPLS